MKTVKVAAKKVTAKEDQNIDQALRPTEWHEYVGQEKIKNNLRVIIDAAKTLADRGLKFAEPTCAETDGQSQPGGGLN
jgi:Holliday junction resolvasome RuvABC ATP-dependent DNA helicase subunit